ncbi:hypothetical protein [Burkholderia ubonensis]|uniref:hypothetical protein n=1 Tax=Burkholderia ubonensis TaxID=101571 RepID=UPI0012F97292|nr:hypothetical protein [Burkholderia ubonensis]
MDDLFQAIERLIALSRSLRRFHSHIEKHEFQYVFLSFSSLNSLGVWIILLRVAGVV